VGRVDDEPERIPPVVNEPTIVGIEPAFIGEYVDHAGLDFLNEGRKRIYIFGRLPSGLLYKRLDYAC
jgi:hypothetical protein